MKGPGILQMKVTSLTVQNLCRFNKACGGQGRGEGNAAYERAVLTTDLFDRSGIAGTLRSTNNSAAILPHCPSSAPLSVA